MAESSTALTHPERVRLEALRYAVNDEASKIEVLLRSAPASQLDPVTWIQLHSR